MVDEADRHQLPGCLLGTALGDALGLPCEGLSARAIARRFGRVERFRLLGTTGFVSDDTELSALVAQSLARSPEDIQACVRAFRRALLGWFCRLPWGVGWATVRACLRIGLGIRQSGVMSAGNGAATRAGVVGVFFQDQPEPRRAFGRALAEVTHRDPRAVEGALFVAEIAAACARASSAKLSGADLDAGRRVVVDDELGRAIDRALALARKEADVEEAARACGTTGYVVHTVPFAVYCLLRFGDDPWRALTEAIRVGGDTDSIAAILGCWLGALHGEKRLPALLLGQIHDGPFGPTHLRALGLCLEQIRAGGPSIVPTYSWPRAFARNLVLYPVVLSHGLLRIISHR